MLLKAHKTNKLYYNAYLYKLVVRNSLSDIFRDKNFPHARSVLDQLQNSYEGGQKLIYSLSRRTKSVDLMDFRDAKILLNEFQKKDDFTLRIDYPSCHIFSNDKQWLLDLSKKVNAVEYWEPKKNAIDILRLKNTIIVENCIPYEFKVTLGPKVDPSFAAWAEKNANKVKVGPKLLQYIAEGGYVQGMYFYVRDQRILELLSIMIGTSIKRLDKVVCAKNIDK